MHDVLYYICILQKYIILCACILFSTFTLLLNDRLLSILCMLLSSKSVLHVRVVSV